MVMIVENFVVKYKISREECDKYVLQLQQRWKVVNDVGYFNDEMVLIEVKIKKGKQIMQVDEYVWF